MNFPDARHIRRRAKGEGFIEDYMKEELSKIRSDIENASEKGELEAWTELRTDFDVPTMNPAEAQLRIYYFIFKTLQDKNYNAKFKFKGQTANNQKVWIRTRWLTPDDANASSYMRKVLQSVTIAETVPEQPVRRRRRRRKKK